MPSQPLSSPSPSPSETARAVWGLGNYHRVARELMWELGPTLVSACGIRPGDRVLDVAAGSGNVAIRAAQAGAAVVAADLSPENLAAGRGEAERAGVALRWEEADAQALPYEDGAFDVVTSCLGAIFAPDQRAVASELARVCRPGGTIGMINFARDGLASRFFGVFAPYGPPPPAGAATPLDWGDEHHVRALLGDHVASLRLEPGAYVERMSGGPEAYCAHFKAHFGPIVATYASLAGDAGRAAALDAEFLAFAERENRGAPGGPAEYRYEYLLVVARTPA